MKRLLGGSDIKENCQIESCFDLYHCTRVSSREQTVNLLANSPSVVRVHAMVPRFVPLLMVRANRFGSNI